MPKRSYPLALSIAAVVALSTFGLVAVLRAGGTQVGTVDDTLLETAREIQDEIEAIRGLEFRHAVEFERIDPDGVDAFIRREIDRQGGPERIAFHGDVARLLGWAEPDDDLGARLIAMLREQVAGLYDPVSKRFFLATGLSESLARVTLAHELVHALDDQHYDLGATILERTDNGDRGWAFHAVVEGSATAVHTQWMMANLRSLMADMAAIQAHGTKGMAGVPDYLWKPMVGTYLFGAAFLNRSSSVAAGQTRRPAADDIDRALREPPESSEQILHPEKYWDPDRHDAPVPVELVLDRVPEEWSVLGEDTFGEVGLAFATDRNAGAARFSPVALQRVSLTNEAAAGWGGDRHVVLGRGDGARVLVAQIVFDTEADVEQFRRAVDGLGEWRGQRLAALARSIGGEGAPWAELVAPGAGKLALRWVLAAGVDPDEASELSKRITAK